MCIAQVCFRFSREDSRMGDFLKIAFLEIMGLLVLYNFCMAIFVFLGCGSGINRFNPI